MSAASGRPLVRRSGGRGALAADARIVFILLNEARYRALARTLGCSREQANVATLVAGLALTHAASERLHRLLAAPGAPSAPDAMLGTASLREVLSLVGGPSVQESPQLGTLLLAAIIAGGAAPTLIKSAHGLRRLGHDLNQSFRHRYGYLVDPGQMRRRHYETHAARGDSAVSAEAP